MEAITSTKGFPLIPASHGEIIVGARGPIGIVRVAVVPCFGAEAKSKRPFKAFMRSRQVDRGLTTGQKSRYRHSGTGGVGESCLAGQGIRTATATVVEDCSVVRI